MVSLSKFVDITDIEKRAAQVRGQWSPAERRLRTGLPPDVPARLRDLILAPRQSTWRATGPQRSTKK
jgi:hypothetical protein